MMEARPRGSRRRRSSFLLTAAAIALSASGCAGGPGLGAAPNVATEAEWRALRQDRPTPLDGAATVTMSEVRFLRPLNWDGLTPVPLQLGVAELAAAGLMRRRDVDFVERRRFSAAAAAERRGARRLAGQPAAGVSRSVEYGTTATWIPMSADNAAVDVQLTRIQTGDVEAATRVRVEPDADPVTVARAIVEGVLLALDELDERPTWADPLEPTLEGEAVRPNVIPSAGVAEEALVNFLRGLAAEERWDWEGARRGYQSAAEEGEFHEAATALARAARLRLGGTLAES